MSFPGENLARLLAELGSESDWSCTVNRAGSRAEWALAGSTWTAQVIIDPPRWIGFAFESVGSDRLGTVTYFIDTDSYDFAEGVERDIALGIEGTIIEFLHNLRNGLVRRGTDRKRPFIIFPLNGSYVRVVRGRFGMTATTTEAISFQSFHPCEPIA